MPLMHALIGAIGWVVGFLSPLYFIHSGLEVTAGELVFLVLTQLEYALFCNLCILGNDNHRCFIRVNPCTTKYGGMVNKYIGDAVMAVFGAPLDMKDHAANAIRAACEMAAAREELNAVLKQKGMPLLKTGFGIHSGPVYCR